MDKSFEKRGYKIGVKIGGGTFSTVRAAIYTNSKRTKDLAVKIVEKSAFKTEPNFPKFLRQEIEVLKRIRHPNIVMVFSIYDSGDKMFIFMGREQMDLLNYLQNNAVSENKASFWFRQLCQALKYLHSLGYAHRDLKTENMLISFHDNLKLADFGFSRYVLDDNNKLVLSNTTCGSTAYAAPEVLLCQPYNAFISDVYSTGVILYMMICRNFPFDTHSMTLQVKQQFNRYYSESKELKSADISKECLDVIHMLLEPRASKRPDVGRVLENVWLHTT